MKLTTVAFIILLSLNIYTVHAQEPSKQLDEATKLKIEKLRDLEKELQRLESESQSSERPVDNSKANAGLPSFRDWDIKVSGNDAASLTLTIKAWERFPGGTKTLLNVSLKEADIPDEYITQKLAAGSLGPNNCGSLAPVKYSHGIGKWYRLEEDYVYNSPTYRMTALKGFDYDRASIPRLLTVIITKEELGSVAPLLHDLLYRFRGVLPPDQISPYRKFSQNDADNLFRTVLEQCGVGPVRSKAAYEAVNRAGRRSWEKGRPHGN